MKALNPLKVPFGKAKFSRIRSVSFHNCEDAFDVEFEDGLCFLEPHATIRKANKISAKALPIQVEVDEELHSHFKVTYDTGEIAEVSWAFIRELPPKVVRSIKKG